MAGGYGDGKGSKQAGQRRSKGPLYVVEHMEEGLENWCRLEYRHMASFVCPERLIFLKFTEDAEQLAAAGSPPPRASPTSFAEIITRPDDGAEAVAAKSPPGGPPLPTWDRICLLDMDADQALEPEDINKFDALVFGGILGNIIENEDGSYGSDDRTSEIRKFGFAHRRHLGPMQMTTDTAVLVSHRVLEAACPLAEIPFLDSPEFEQTGQDGQGTKDSVCMEGFRYVARRGADGDWEPTLPEGMKELLLADADNNILDSL
eukprot:TRINITY_DN35061_c0_g1_i1.p1 TRINITY_DN35061_c0_g1~~TRINITY_DN35061_c0_g1_i1.p1  ORF type:complete len:276 (+),score=52.01 TRINITY_DN35061_c0_g1_i1:47-829(+)